MKKVSIFFLVVSALVAANTTQMIESYGVGCAEGAKAMGLQNDFVKVEQACSDCIQKVPTTGIDKTDENVKIMVSKCVETYKASRN